MPVIVTHGLAELRAALKQMSADAPKELAKANKRVGQIVATEAIRLAPTGPHEGGGKVRPITKSIHALQSQNKVTIAAGGKSSPQAAGTEFGGTIPRRGFKGRKSRARRLANFFGGNSVTHLTQHPYLLPAIHNKLEEVVDAYEQMLVDVAAKFRRA